MRWLTRLFDKQPVLSPELAVRLAAWQALPEPALNQPLRESSVVIVDVETSGLNPHKDQLLAIGAVTVNGPKIAVGSGFDVVIRGAGTGDKENILVHGISPSEQSRGVPMAEALLALLEYIGKRPLVAYHSPFDELVIGRHLKAHLGVRLPNRWMDLCWLAPALVPEAGLQSKGLDRWMERYQLRAFQRHRALSDCLVTAELLLILYKRAAARDIDSFQGLADLAELTFQAAKAGRAGGF